jgi:hypothetical protein
VAKSLRAEDHSSRQRTITSWGTSWEPRADSTSSGTTVLLHTWGAASTLPSLKEVQSRTQVSWAGYALTHISIPSPDTFILFYMGTLPEASLVLVHLPPFPQGHKATGAFSGLPHQWDDPHECISPLILCPLGEWNREELVLSLVLAFCIKLWK